MYLRPSQFLHSLPPCFLSFIFPYSHELLLSAFAPRSLCLPLSPFSHVFCFDLRCYDHELCLSPSVVHWQLRVYVLSVTNVVVSAEPATYDYAPPTITSLSSESIDARGQVLKIYGENFGLLSASANTPRPTIHIGGMWHRGCLRIHT
jgi:hypothetical protein